MDHATERGNPYLSARILATEQLVGILSSIMARELPNATDFIEYVLEERTKRPPTVTPVQSDRWDEEEVEIAIQGWLHSCQNVHRVYRQHRLAQGHRQ